MVKIAVQQKVNVDPNPLEVHGGDVGFTMSAELPVAMMKKGTKYTLEVSYVPTDVTKITDGTPIEQISGNALSVGAIPFDGDKYQGQTENPNISKDFNFAYEPKYENGGLVVKGIATKLKNNKSKEFGPVPLRVQDGGFVKGIATTSLLLKSPVDGVNPSTGESPFAYGAHGFQGPKDEFLSVDIFFEQGSATVTPNTAGNKQVIETVSELFKGTQVPPFTATGVSTHSPEGREAINTDLAEKRAAALEQQFKRTMALLKYKEEQLKDYQFSFEKRVLGETLPEFNELVDGSSLTPEQKSEAKSIMGKDGDFVEKEQELQSKPYYRTLMTEVYPKMRRASTQVKKPGAAKSLPEMSALVKKIQAGEEKAEALTEQEYLYTAANTPDLDERLAILNTAAQKYQTWKVHNNIGATLMDIAIFKNDMSKVDQAIGQFEASMGKRETGEAAYNLAMAYSLKGDQAKMEEYLKKAVSLRSGDNDPTVAKLIKGAEGYLKFKEAKRYNDGRYQDAEDILSQAAGTVPNIFNKGLAQLLNRKYDAALSSFSSAAQKNPKDAVVQYAMAVAYARKGDESNMAAALKKSCELNANMKAKALRDVEFDKYKESAGFRDAIK
ncbi:MAG: hypothetical protein OHK0053_20030 [Microscillaceae bacterium]